MNSPQLLQIAVIGPAEHLRSIGVPVIHDLPGVGANFSDQYDVRFPYRIKELLSINDYSRSMRLAGEVMKWLATGQGALTFGVSAHRSFVGAGKGSRAPTFSCYFLCQAMTRRSLILSKSSLALPLL